MMIVVDQTEYPSFDEYHGGGSIINKFTTAENVIREVHESIIREVTRLVSNGCEVIVLGGEIKAVRKVV